MLTGGHSTMTWRPVAIVSRCRWQLSEDMLKSCREATVMLRANDDSHLVQSSTLVAWGMVSREQQYQTKGLGSNPSPQSAKVRIEVLPYEPNIQTCIELHSKYTHPHHMWQSLQNTKMTISMCARGSPYIIRTTESKTISIVRSSARVVAVHFWGAGST